MSPSKPSTFYHETVTITHYRRREGTKNKESAQRSHTSPAGAGEEEDEEEEDDDDDEKNDDER